MREQELFVPVKTYLEGQGYSVHGEVTNWDIAAVKDGELIAIELKLRFCLSLVYQALRRKKTADSVYVCVPVRGSKGRLSNHSDAKGLLKELGIGLLVVRFTSRNITVVPEIHPSQTVHGGKRRQRILREIDSRYTELTGAGLPSTEPVLTAYRQKALRIAWTMIVKDNGVSTPQNLKTYGCPVTTGDILRANHYGWFDKLSRGLYAVSEEGRAAVTGYYRPYISSLLPYWNEPDL